MVRRRSVNGPRQYTPAKRLGVIVAQAILVLCSCDDARPGPPESSPFDDDGPSATDDDDEGTSPIGGDDDADDDVEMPPLDAGGEDDDVPPIETDAGEPEAPEPEVAPVPVSSVSPPGISVGRPPSLMPDPLPIPPTNCEPVDEANDGMECEAEFECDGNDYLFTRCVQEEESWFCECDSTLAFQRYTLAGVDAETACSVAADLCDTSVEPEYSAVSECSAIADNVSDGHCDQQLSCHRSSVLDDGVEVSANEARAVACDVDDSGAVQCQCSAPGVARAFVLTDIAIDEACPTVLELCPNDVPEFEGSAQCAADYEFQTDEYCERQVACERQADVSLGIVLREVEYEYTRCETGEAGTRCSCADASRTLVFDVDRPRSNAATCTAMNELCREETPSAPSGAVECVDAGRAESEEYCEVNFECSQSAEFGSESIALLGSVYAYCTLDRGTEWTCTCRSGSEEGTLTVDAAEQSACSDLDASCQDVIDVAIGQQE